jgi:hypothetical protein
MEPKFTPGPWKVRHLREGHVDETFVAQSLAGSIAGVDGMGRDINRANAALIAAAPDLYAALERVLHWQPNDSASDLVAVAEAALSRARGES